MKTKKTSKESPEKIIKELEKQLQEKNKQIEENINNLKRLQADFENHIKRTEKENSLIEIKSKQKLFLEILKKVDTFEAALDSLKKTESNKETLQGIGNIHNQLVKFLEGHQVNKIQITEKLDPFKHEVIKQLESDKEENTILEEVQKGYLFHNDILRPSKVIVSKKIEVKENLNTEMKQNE